MCCNVLQYVLQYVLQCVLQYDAVCVVQGDCNLIDAIPVCCGVCCSVLQCIAVYCSACYSISGVLFCTPLSAHSLVFRN